MADYATQSVVAHYEYDPFGNVTWSHGLLAGSNPYRFSTKHTDDESGLVYNGYRFYSPEMGRWVNRDPIEEEGGLNLYGFVGNNGVNQIDPRGLIECKNGFWKVVHWKEIFIGPATSGKCNCFWLCQDCVGTIW